MVFFCQKDSFLKTYSTTVLSCEKKDSNDSPVYEIICEDTILFPEGGGQPHDTGYLDNVEVYQVLRRGAEAVHFTKQPIPVNSKVTQTIHWPRRLDHMQQHSGQHLITAIINLEFQIATTSWWLGADVSHIELDTKEFTNDQIMHIEEIVNQKIQDQIPVVVKLYDRDDPDLGKARTRGLPVDVSGPIRVVDIVGIEEDVCCGTHVANLSQIRIVKLLYAEKGKKNKTNLFFLAGNRVTQYMNKMLKTEAKLTKLLSSTPNDHPDLVTKLQANVKLLNKQLLSARKQLAQFEAKQLLLMNPRPKYFLHHKDADVDYLEAFLRALKDEKIEDVFLVLTAGDTAGTLFVVGDENIVSTLGPQCAELLEGKGIAHGRKFQARVAKLKNVKKAHQLVATFFEKT